MCDHQEKEYKHKKTTSSKSQQVMQHHLKQGHRHHRNHSFHSAEDTNDLHPNHQNQRDCDKTHHPHHGHIKQKRHCVSESTTSSTSSLSSSSISSSSSSSSLSTSSSSSSSFSTSSTRSSPSSSQSSESSSEFSDRYRPRRPQHSQSFTDVSGKHKYFEEDDDTVPLINARRNLNRSSTKKKRDLGKSFSSCPSNGGLKNNQTSTRQSGNEGSFRKAKSMEDIQISKDREGNGNEQERSTSEARKNLLKEKMKFSAFLNEITRQVLSPMRLTSLGVTDAQRPYSPGQVSPRSRETDSSADKPRQRRSRPVSPDSVSSSKHSHTSKHSHSSRLSHSKSFQHFGHRSSNSPSHKKRRSRSCHSWSPTPEHHSNLPSGKHCHHHHNEDHSNPSHHYHHGCHHTASHHHHHGHPSPVYQHQDHHSPTHYNTSHSHEEKYHKDSPAQPYSPAHHHEKHHSHGRRANSHDYHHGSHHDHAHNHRDNYNANSHCGGHHIKPHHHEDHHSSGHQHHNHPNSSPTTPCHHGHHSPTSNHGVPQAPIYEHHHADHHREAHHHKPSDHKSGSSHFHHQDHRHSQGHQPSHSNQCSDATHHCGDNHKEVHHLDSKHHIPNYHYSQHHHNKFQNYNPGHPHLHGDQKNECHGHYYENHHSEAHHHPHEDHYSPGHHHHHAGKHNLGHLPHYGDQHNETHHHHHGDQHNPGHHHHHGDQHSDAHHYHHGNQHSEAHHHQHGNQQSEAPHHHHGDQHNPGHHHHHGNQHSEAHHHQHGNQQSEAPHHHYGDQHNPGHHHHHGDQHSEAYHHHHGDQHGPGHHHHHGDQHGEAHHHGDQHSPGHHHHHGDQHGEALHHHHRDQLSPDHQHHHRDQLSETHHHLYGTQHSPGHHHHHGDGDFKTSPHQVHHPESQSDLSHCKHNNHDNNRVDDKHTNLMEHSAISPPSHRNPESLVTKDSLSNTNSPSSQDEEQTSFTVPSSHETQTQESGRVMILQDQNEGLHQSLLKTAVRMECLGEEFISSQKVLETELQRTRMELSNLMDRFKRLQDDCSSTQQTNSLLEQKLHLMLQNMEGERERLNRRISELTEQLTDVKIANTMEAINQMTSVLHQTNLQSQPDDALNQMVPPIAPPPAEFMDSHSYEKEKNSGQEQPLGSVPEEEESDWSEMGEETPRLILTGVNRTQTWRQLEADMDKDSESGSEEIIRRHSPYPMQIPHLQFTIHNEFLPPAHANSCPSDFKNLSDSLQDEESYRITTSHNLKSAILIRSASLEDIPLTRHHMHEELRGTEAMMNLHHSADEATEDLDNEILHHWRMSNNRDTVIRRMIKGRGEEVDSSLAGLQSAEQLLKHLMCDSSEAAVHVWTGGVPDEELNVERTPL